MGLAARTLLGADLAPVSDQAGGAPTGHSTVLTRGWKIQSSQRAAGTGAEISQPGYDATAWLSISQPETLMAGLLENGRYPNILFSNNLASVDQAQFEVNWWYRAELELHPRAGQHTFLVMRGVLSRANLWVNGARIADQSELQGAYSRFEYDLTGRVRDGANAIALDVYPNDSSEETGYLTVDTNDWNPPSPDRLTGLQYAPVLEQAGAVSLQDVHVLQENAADLSRSELTVRAALRNNTDTPQSAELSGSITRPGTSVPFTRRVELAPRATVAVAVGPGDVPALRLVRPAIWWPYQLGDQPLYHLAVSARAGAAASDEFAEDFGIRSVTSRLTPVVPGQTIAPHGSRQFVINGIPLVIRGGGWSQDLFLRYSTQNVHDQLSYVRSMGLNAIRFEGNFPPDDMLEQMDRMGLLAMPGWLCCDKWEQDSSKWSDGIKANAANQAAHMARRLRDHPSVFVFYQGSDNEPDPAKEAIYLDAFRAADWRLPQVAAAEYKASAELGPSGSKEGPYNYAPPIYWWNAGPEMEEGGDFTNAGGAFAFQTEASPGNTIPTLDSLNRFLTPDEQREIWDVSSAGGKGTGPDIYHTSRYTNYAAVGRLGQYNTPIWNRYGHWSDMASYEREAQAGGYEVTRAEFEAYLGHSKDPANPSTGIIYWMMNKAWPSLQWELYGADFDQPGVFFGAQKAGEPVHILYAYDDGSIKVVNLTRETQSDLQATAEFVDVDGSIKATLRAAVPALPTQDVQTVLRPEVPAGISTTFFLKLTLAGAGGVLSRNVYWLSTKPDRIDWARTVSRGHGSGSGAFFQPDGYADLTGLRDLAPARITVAASSQTRGEDEITTVTLRNTSSGAAVGFLLRADVRRGSADGQPASGDNQVLPILWSENMVTIWPGESQTLVARYARSALRGAAPVVTLSGWNVAPQTAPAPLTPVRPDEEP